MSDAARGSNLSESATRMWQPSYRPLPPPPDVPATEEGTDRSAPEFGEIGSPHAPLSPPPDPPSCPDVLAGMLAVDAAEGAALGLKAGGAPPAVRAKHAAAEWVPGEPPKRTAGESFDDQVRKLLKQFPLPPSLPPADAAVAAIGRAGARGGKAAAPAAIAATAGSPTIETVASLTGLSANVLRALQRFCSEPNFSILASSGVLETVRDFLVSQPPEAVRAHVEALKLLAAGVLPQSHTPALPLCSRLALAGDAARGQAMEALAIQVPLRLRLACAARARRLSRRWRTAIRLRAGLCACRGRGEHNPAEQAAHTVSHAAQHGARQAACSHSSARRVVARPRAQPRRRASSGSLPTVRSAARAVRAVCLGLHAAAGSPNAVSQKGTARGPPARPPAVLHAPRSPLCAHASSRRPRRAATAWCA